MMISRAGQRRARRTVRRRTGAPDGRRAFTLLELVLAIGVIALLWAVAFVAQAGGRDSQAFEEGVCRFEAALRMAKADAASHGRKLRLGFDEEEGTPRIEWEPQPLTEPGEFSSYTANTWVEDVPAGMLRVLRCELVGPGAYRTLIMETARGSGPDGEELDAITFYADGSCDSAVIELAPNDEVSPLRALIELDGLNGTIQCRTLTLTELEEYYELIEEGEYVGPMGV